MQPNAIIRFTTHWPYDPTSLIIARLGGSKIFSHSMTIIDGTAYEATMMHNCRYCPEERAMQGVARYQDMYVEIPDIAASVRWGVEQDGKPYDFAGAFGIPFMMSEDWQDDTKWWCSEHTYAMCRAGGLTLLDPFAFRRVRPEDLRNCNYPKSLIITR
jgi:hypothetical protein